MPRSHLDRLARYLADRLRGRNDALCLQMTRLLIKGQPVPPERLAAALAMTTARVTELLARLPDVERDEVGNVVGWGLSLIPTPHRFHVHGHTLYTWCALDALTYPSLFDLSVVVESHCPITGLPVSLSLNPTGIENLTPASAVISVMVPASVRGCECDRSAFCNQGHFFHSQEAASIWQALHQQTQLLAVEDAYQLGRLVAHHRYGAMVGT